jgi:hypothetical protein
MPKKKENKVWEAKEKLSGAKRDEQDRIVFPSQKRWVDEDGVELLFPLFFIGQTLKKCQTITRPGWYSQHLRACIGHFFLFFLQGSRWIWNNKGRVNNAGGDISGNLANKQCHV